MLDKTRIGHEFPAFQVSLEKGRLRLFAKAIGETRSLYINEASAKSVGYPSLPMPPSFAFCLGKDIEDPFDTLNLLGIDIATVRHGEQEFVYHRMAYAGDTLTGRKRIIDIYEKKNAALEFIVVKIVFHDLDNRLICELSQTIIVKGNRSGQS